MLLAVIHVGESGGAEDPVRLDEEDGVLDGAIVGDVERPAPLYRVTGIGARGLVAAGAQGIEEGRAHLARGADDERAHQRRPRAGRGARIAGSGDRRSGCVMDQGESTLGARCATALSPGRS